MSKFVVTEYQTTDESTTALINYVYTDRNTAEQKYHEILSYAAVSSLPIHAASMANEYGGLYKNEFYEHTPAPEPEPTPDPEPTPETT